MSKVSEWSDAELSRANFQERIPILFEDIVTEQRQAEMMRLLR